MDLNALKPKFRPVIIEGIGHLLVRRPTLGEVAAGRNNPNWWGCCVAHPDGQPLFVMGGVQPSEIDAQLAEAILAEISAPRPTQPPSGGSGESQTT